MVDQRVDELQDDALSRLGQFLDPLEAPHPWYVLAEFGSALAPDERERIEETLKRSREISATGDSRDALNEALFDMQGVSKVLTRVMLQRAGSGAPGVAAPTPSS